MKISKKFPPLLALLLFCFAVFSGQTVNADNAKAVFGVAWYDVGRAALEGLKGVHKVTSGWKDFMEINTVHYDPAEITTVEMEKILKKAGTYRNTIQVDWQHVSPRE